MLRRILHIVSVLAVASVPAFAQISLSGFTAGDIKEGSHMPMIIDSLMLETDVGNGLATTIMTVVLHPAAFTSERGLADTARRLDSIQAFETFTLPTDFVAKNLWLWVNGERQTGYIQDKAVAEAQYAAIVGWRKDPAILSFSGQGRYDLKIFPFRTNTPRKFAIEFEHTMDDDTADLVTACIPVSFDMVNASSWWPSGAKRLPIGFVKATLRTSDRQQYAFKMAGLGEGAFSPLQPLNIVAANVSKLSPGSIEADDRSGSNEFLWAGIDSAKGKVSGFSTVLTESTVDFINERVCIIILDLREQYCKWSGYSSNSVTTYSNPLADTTVLPPVDMWLRAQKLAILSLQNYLDQNAKFNLIIAGESAVSLFPYPVAPTPENLALAYRAILSASPSADAFTLEALKLARQQSPGAEIILISDLCQPPDYYTIRTSGAYSYTSVSPHGLSFDSLMQAISALVDSAGFTLFTIADEQKLNTIATRSGGRNLASLRNPYYYSTTQSNARYLIQLPDLFSYYNQGISGVTVTSSDLSNIVFTTDGGYGGGSQPIRVMVVDAMVLAKMTLPCSYGSNTLLRVAGKLNRDHGRHSERISAIVAGTMNGKKFTKEINGFVPVINDNDATVSWAFRKTEQLGNENYSANAAEIEQIGRGYHIVTQKTSLLALEPGMDLWKDTLTQTQGAVDAGANVRVFAVAAQPAFLMVADARMAIYDTVSYQPYQQKSLDNITVAELIALAMPVENPVTAESRTDIALNAGLNKVEIILPESEAGSSVSAVVYDLQGKLVLSKIFSKNDILSSRILWNESNGLKLAKGFYALHITTGKMVKFFRLPISN